MRYLKYFFTSLLLWALWGCGEPSYKQQNSAYIVLKTPTFKYADMGFIYENSDAIKVEIYGSGQALMTLKITKDSVCMSRLQCMTKQTFNAQVLSRDYPKDVIENIFRGRAVFNGMHIMKKSNGFTQKLKNPGKYDIEYRVLNNEILFRDTINEILIKVIKQ